jgi:hypothetical protein
MVQGNFNSMSHQPEHSYLEMGAQQAMIMPGTILTLMMTGDFPYCSDDSTVAALPNSQYE